MIRINLIRGKRKKRRELNVGYAFLLAPLVVLLGTLFFHTTVAGRSGPWRRASGRPTRRSSG
jgi:hypothetical protein